MIPYNFGMRQEEEITMKWRASSSLIMHLPVAF